MRDPQKIIPWEGTVNDKLVKSAVRVLDIFEAFEAEQRALTISDLVDILQIPQSSMSTLIKSLVARGFVEYDAESRRYRPSVRLAFLGNWALGSTGVIARIHALAQELHDETGEAVLLGAENGLHMQYLSLVIQPNTLRVSLHPGLRRPIHRSGLGTMLLSHKNDGDIGRIVRRYNAVATEADEVGLSGNEVLRRVAEARRQGWFFSENMVVKGGASLATLLPLPRENTTLAIGFGGTTPAMADKVDGLKEILLSRVRTFAEASPMNA
jgi:DNA-binding IclR family transcriptional regulator